MGDFNPRSLTGATFDIHVFSTQISISIHAPSRERRCCSISIGIPHIFQSTLPRGSDYLTATELLSIVEFQSTLPRGSDPDFFDITFNEDISIHAPSRERQMPNVKRLFISYFNPRSLAGATERRSRNSRCIRDFNPRSLAGATQPNYKRFHNPEISIHAPSRERRQINSRTFLWPRFQSTLPRGSDYNYQHRYQWAMISIHAPSRERPHAEEKSYSRFLDFNPRSLAGATASKQITSLFI